MGRLPEENDDVWSGVDNYLPLFPNKDEREMAFDSIKALGPLEAGEPDDKSDKLDDAHDQDRLLMLKLSPAVREARLILLGKETPPGGWSQDGLRRAAEMHWSRITSGFDPSPMNSPKIRAPRERAVMWRLACPSCSAKFALFGVDANPRTFHEDAVWMHLYRRVELDYHGLEESWSEGQYEAFMQVRFQCLRGGCRGFEKYRIETIVRRMHALRGVVAPGTVVTGALPSV